MKKHSLLFLIILIVLLTSLCACGQRSESTPVATTAPAPTGAASKANETTTGSSPLDEHATAAVEAEYRSEMENLLLIIQNSINSNDQSALFDLLDPQYPRECFLASELVGKVADAYKDLIPAIPYVSAFPGNGTLPSKQTRIAYISDNINGASGTVTYSVSDNTGDSQEEKISVFNSNGRWYITCSTLNEYLYSVLNGGGYGSIPYAVSLSSVDLSSVESYRRGNYVGFCTEDKSEVLKPYFDEAYSFVDGYCPVSVDGKWGFINSQGAMVVDYIFSDVLSAPQNGYWWVEANGKWGAVNFIESKIIPCNYNTTGPDYLIVVKDQKYGITDINGSMLVPCEYDWLGLPGKDDATKTLIPAKKSGYYGVIDVKGNVVADFIYTSLGGQYTNGVLLVELNGAHGAIDSAGQYIVRINADYRDAKIEQNIAIMFKTGSNPNDWLLYDFDGNKMLPEYSFNGNYFRLNGDSCVFYTAYNNSSQPQKFDQKVFLIDSEQRYIDLSDKMKVSLAAAFPAEYEKAKTNSYSGWKLYDTGNPSVIGIVVHLGTNFTSGFDVFNFIDASGNLMLDNWALGFGNMSYLKSFGSYSRFIIYTNYESEAEEYEWYALDRETAEISYLGKSAYNLLNIDTLRLSYIPVQNLCTWCSPTKHAICLSTGTWKGGYEDFVIDLSNMKLCLLSEYIGIDYDLTVKEHNDDTLIVSDGIFYGLLTADGFVGDGLVYTNYNFDEATEMFTLHRGSQTSNTYRILPDGNAVEASEADVRPAWQAPPEYITAEQSVTDNSAQDYAPQKDYIVISDFFIEGKWKNIGTSTYGQVQSGAIVVFDGTHCNVVSPQDTYAFYKNGDNWRLDCTTLLGDTLSFTVKTVDEDNIDIYFGSSYLEMTHID